MLNSFEREQISQEIRWLKNKIDELRPKAARKPSVVREIGALKRQITEREVSLAFNDHAGRN